MTGDTHQTSYSTATPHSTRSLNEDEKQPNSKHRYFRNYEWLLGNNAFLEPIKPVFRPTAPLTGTGTCTLPTTVQVLQAYFDDPLSKIIFTNHLAYGTQEKMDNLKEFAQLMDQFDPAHPEGHDPLLVETCKKVQHGSFYHSILKHPAHWKLDQAMLKQEWQNSPLVEWCQIRINWAIDKQQYIKQLYRENLATISTGAWTNNNAFQKKATTEEPKKSSSSSSSSSDDEESSSSSELHEQGNPKKNVVKDSPGKFFKTLPDHVFKNGIVVVNMNFPSMPNTNLRPTRFPIQTDEFNPLLSDGYNAPSVTCVEKFRIPPDQINAKQADLFTYHRYWALYYIKLLDRFIQAHMPICRSFCVNDVLFSSHSKPRSKEQDNVLFQKEQFFVPTVFQPFDEAYAKWNWTPLQGHQGSYEILKSLYPSEFIFHHTLYDLYMVALKQDFKIHLDATETFLIKSMQGVAKTIYDQWMSRPLLPLSLMPDEEWVPPEPFSPNNLFLWTFLVVVGRLEQLKQEVFGIQFTFESEDANTQSRRDIEIDFHLHQLQVRQTGYLTTARWMMSQMVLKESNESAPKGFNDSTLPESVINFPYEDVDFDGELDMPDLSALLQKLNFWRRNSFDSQNNVILVAFQKGIPFRSHGRVLSDQFLKVMLQQDPKYISLAMLFVTCSSLGLYRRLPTAPEMFRPSFAGMVKIDFALLQTPKQMFNFIHVTKSKLIVYMSRETLVHEVAKSPHFREWQVLDWDQLESNTWHVQNLMRRHLENTKFWLHAPHNNSRRQLEDQINNLYEKNYNILLYQLQDFPHKILKFFYNAHVDLLDKIIALNVKLEQWKSQLHLALAKQEADEAEIAALRESIEKASIELSMISYELPEQVRSIIWQSLLGYRNDIDIWTVIRQWLKDDDLLLFQRLHNAYTSYSSKSKFENIISQFSIPSFTMIYFLLQTRTTLSRVKLVAIPKQMAQNIHLAMRRKRHRLFESQPMLSSIYNIYITFCCNSVMTFTGANSFGNDHLTFNRGLGYFSCCQKKTKKGRNNEDDDDDYDEDDEEEGSDGEEAKPAKGNNKKQGKVIMKLQTGKTGSMDDYPNMMDKARRKIARRFDNESRPLRCHNNPPVLVVNMQGFRLYFGSEEYYTSSYQHCPRCGDWHYFSDKNFSSRGYMCPNCIQKTWQPSFAMQRQMFCAYCGRQHMKDVEHGLESIKMIDAYDMQEPVKMLQLCHNDMPKHAGDFFVSFEAKRIKLPFIDTYLKRHHNMVRATTVAQFPLQNTVENNRQGLSMKNNGFSWIRYGTRIHLIPQPIDVWWPHSKRKPLPPKKKE